MKKVVLGLLLLALFYLSTPSKTLAQTKPILSPSPTEALMSEDKQMEKEKEATQSSQPEIDEYPLPYPGILPDNPLHFLKALRDRIILMLMSDPVKEAEFNLLTSDKRIYAAQLLADKGKGQLSISTLSKIRLVVSALISACENNFGKDNTITIEVRIIIDKV